MNFTPDASQIVPGNELEELYEFAPCGYISTRIDGTICRVNETFVNLLGRPREELLAGRKFQELMTMAGRVFYDTHFGPLIRIRGFVKEIACDLLREDGSKVAVLVNAVNVDAKDGVEGSIRFTVFDATERRQYENDLLEARRRADHYKTIVQASADAILSFDADAKILTWNLGAAALFDHSAAEAIGKKIWDIVVFKDLDIDTVMATLAAGGPVNQVDVAKTPRRGSIDVSVSLNPHIEPGGGLTGVSAIIRDVTERQRLVEAKNQQELLKNLIESQEAERQRFARDLHDHVGQELTGLRLALSDLSAATDAPHLNEKIDRLLEHARRMDGELTYIAFELRPNILHQNGLIEAAENFVKEWSRNHNIHATFHGSREDPRRLSPEIEINLYRIMQESLNNVLKHAQAETVTVLIDERDSQVRLIIEDDGLGFAPETKQEPVKISGHGLGLVGMRERAAVIKGTIEVESAADQGTTVFVRVPAVYDGGVDWLSV